MKLKSFGCSFFYGNDLHDDKRPDEWPLPSNFTWPALIAKELGYEYECHARPGSGNLQILERIIAHTAAEDSDVIYLINWSWAERFDYITNADPRWRDVWETICPVDDSHKAEFYYKYFHSEPRDKLTTLIHIKTAIDLLRHQNIKFYMTYMDDIIFDRRWHATLSITRLQDLIRPYLHSFDGQTFLDWSRTHNFPISETLHPLKEAHKAASKYMLPLICKTLGC